MIGNGLNLPLAYDRRSKKKLQVFSFIITKSSELGSKNPQGQNVQYHIGSMLFEKGEKGYYRCWLQAFVARTQTELSTH